MTVTELLYRIRESWFYNRKEKFDQETEQHYLTELTGKKKFYFYLN